MNLRRCVLLLFTTFLFFNALIAQDASAILGKWKTGTGKAHLEIFRQKNHYFGKIVWLKNPFTPQGAPKTDKRNPEPSLHDRPLMGLVILKNLVYEGGHEYGRGTVYDPESGKTYRCELKLKDKDVLTIRGYIGIKAIGRTDTWQRIKPQ